MADNKLRVVMTNAGRGELWINDEKVPRVKKLTVCVEAGEINRAVIEMHPDEIEIEGVFDVTTIESQAREFKIGNGA